MRFFVKTIVACSLLNAAVALFLLSTGKLIQTTPVTLALEVLTGVVWAFAGVAALRESSK